MTLNERIDFINEHSNYGERYMLSDEEAEFVRKMINRRMNGQEISWGQSKWLTKIYKRIENKLG